MIRRPPRSTQSRSSAASDVYKRQLRKLSRESALYVPAPHEPKGVPGEHQKGTVYLEGPKRRRTEASARGSFSDRGYRDNRRRAPIRLHGAGQTERKMVCRI